MEFAFDCPSNYYELSSLSIRSKLCEAEIENWFSIAHEAPSEPNNIFDELQKRDDLEKENCPNELRPISNKRKRSLSSKVESPTDSRKENHLQTTKARNIVPVTQSSCALKSSKLPKFKSDNHCNISKTDVKSLSHKPSTISLSAESQQPKTAIPTRNVVKSSHIIRKPLENKSSSSSTGKSNQSLIKDKKKAVSIPEKSLEELLREHNSRFVPPPVYIPPKYSVRDVRKWEKLTGKSWSELKPEEREKANDEIGQLKATNAI